MPGLKEFVEGNIKGTIRGEEHILEFSLRGEGFEKYVSKFNRDILFHRDKSFLDGMGKRILQKKHPYDIPLSLFLKYTESAKFCLDRMKNADLLKALPFWESFDQIQEISLIGCSDLSYDALKLLFENFPKTTTLTIQTTDLKNMKKAFEDLFINFADIGGVINIRFDDIVPVPYPKEDKPWLNQKYSPIIERFGLKEIIKDQSDEDNEVWSRWAFEGVIKIDLNNLKMVQERLFSNSFQSLISQNDDNDIQEKDIEEMMNKCKFFLENRNRYFHGLLTRNPEITGAELLKFTQLSRNEYESFSFKKTLAIYLLENRLEVSEEIIPLLWNAAEVMLDKEMKHLIQKRCLEEGIYFIFENSEE